MQTIFNVPMLANALRKRSGIQRQWTDVEQGFGKRSVRSGAHPLHANDPLYAHPLRINLGDTVSDTHCALRLAVTSLLRLRV